MLETRSLNMLRCEVQTVIALPCMPRLSKGRWSMGRRELGTYPGSLVTRSQSRTPTARGRRTTGGYCHDFLGSGLCSEHHLRKDAGLWFSRRFAPRYKRGRTIRQSARKADQANLVPNLVAARRTIKARVLAPMIQLVVFTEGPAGLCRQPDCLII